MKAQLISIALLLLVAAPARASERYAGPHPIAVRACGGYCYIEVSHLHRYTPDHAVLYHRNESGWIFIGDPTPFGYEGPRTIFYGHHPTLRDGSATIYCLIDGPHYHAFAPAPGDDYELVEGNAFYMGELGAPYIAQRAQRWKATNDEILPFARARPRVNVYPPSGWEGRTWVPPWVKVQLPHRPKRELHTRVRVEVR
jgi:hypothetical protein